MIARARAALRRVPTPLAALLGVVLVLGVVWTLAVPPFQAPDEQSHFGYVQSLASGPGLPGQPEGLPFSTEQLSAHDYSNSDQTAGIIYAKPSWSPLEWERWQRLDEELPASARSDGGGLGNPADSNPPLYYLYEVVPYALASGGDFFARVTLARMASVLWLLVTVAGAWLLAGEVFRRDRLRQLVTAGVVGLVPMVMFVSAQIGPDTMMYALWTLVMWLGVRIIKQGLTPASAVALLGLTGVAIVVKATSYALVLPALFALGVGLWRLRGDRRRALTLGGAAVAALLVPVLIWFVVARVTGEQAAAQISDVSANSGGTNPGELVSYLWQFYLPKLPFMTEFAFPGGGTPANQIFVKQIWGAFGWLEVRFPDGFYRVFLWITVALLVAAVARLVATWRRINPIVAIFLALTALALLAGLHWTDFHQLTGGRGSFMQGRYLFPIVALGGLAVAQAVSWLRGGGRAAAVGVALGGLLVLQFASLALVAARFYA